MRASRRTYIVWSLSRLKIKEYFPRKNNLQISLPEVYTILCRRDVDNFNNFTEFKCELKDFILYACLYKSVRIIIKILLNVSDNFYGNFTLMNTFFSLIKNPCHLSAKLIFGISYHPFPNRPSG